MVDREVRDMFAAAVLTGLISSPKANPMPAAEAADLAYKFADAMMVRRLK